MSFKGNSQNNKSTLQTNKNNKTITSSQYTPQNTNINTKNKEENQSLVNNKSNIQRSNTNQVSNNQIQKEKITLPQNKSQTIQFPMEMFKTYRNQERKQHIQTNPKINKQIKKNNTPTEF